MKKTLVAIAIVSSLAVSASAYAVGNTGQGWYVSAGLGASTTTIPTESTLEGNLTETGMAEQLAVGYNVTKYIGAELNYINYAQAASTDKLFRSNTYKADASNLGLVVHSPSFSGVNLFAKVGAQYTNTSLFHDTGVESESQTANTLNIFYGVGAGYAINQHVDAQVQWQETPQINNKGATLPGYAIDIPRFDLYTVGLTYKF